MNILVSHKKMLDAEAYCPRARRFAILGLLVREMELPCLKVGGGLAGQRRHILVNVQLGDPDISRRPAAVAVVIHTDQVFFLHGKQRSHTSNSLLLVFARAVFGV